MKLLLVAATKHEILPFLQHLDLEGYPGLPAFQVKTLITGVGMVSTAFRMGQLANKHFDIAINAGIAGAFDRSLSIGEVVQVRRDMLAELGAEDGDHFLTIDQLGFGNAAFEATFRHPDVSSRLEAVAGITVNTVHGNASRIEQTQSRFNPQVESMEGAAFLYACNQLNLPAMQIRSISNYVEQRNRDNWNIPLAIERLNEFLIEMIPVLARKP